MKDAGKLSGLHPEERSTEIYWHSLPEEEVLKKTQSTIRGLNSQEALERLKEFGPNSLPARKPPALLIIFLHQFLSPLIYILLAAACVSLAIGEQTDAIFILAVILLNATLGCFQEWKAEQSAAALQSLLRIYALVMRDGDRKHIPAETLVPGDIVFLESGSRVPADLRVIETKSLVLDESLLTGESQGVNKDAGEILEKKLPIAERGNMAFAGSTVITGRGAGLVIGTGLSTELGQIAKAVTAEEPTKPPLVLRMERFARQISLLVLSCISLLIAVSMARGTPFTEVFFMAVALAVSAIPEGLPVAMTVALSIATTRMARRNVIVRRLTAVEALGSCTCIASDKTGTLTLNRQTAKVVGLPGGELFSLSGEGYSGEGRLLTSEGETPPKEYENCLRELAKVAVLCNEGNLEKSGKSWSYQGDPVDVALLALGFKTGIDPQQLQGEIEILGEIPFESERRYAARFFKGDGRNQVAVKGAAETILPFCTHSQTPEGPIPIDREMIAEEVQALAEGGFRVIALANGELDELTAAPLDSDQIPPLEFRGLVGLIDPLRPEVKTAVSQCRRAGVKVVMITGDHPATALSIAKELGIAQGPENMITGAQLENIGTPEVPLYLEAVKKATIFSRVAPLQKLEIVEALKRLGHIVAVTGDGVNDAPALRRADIGVAMGSGTDVAKDTASLIVTDDNFASIEGGVEEGRFAYDNLRKVIYLLISTGAAEIVLFTLALFSGLPMPLAAVQLLWLNLVTNGIQGVALAFEGGEPGAMDKQPRPPGEGVFDRLMIQQAVVSGCIMVLVSYALWSWLLHTGWSEYSARNLILLLMVLLENFHVFNCRSERTSALRVPLKRNLLLVWGVALAQGIHIMVMHIPLMQKVLKVEPVSLSQWGGLIFIASLLLLAMEVFKALKKRFEH